MKREIERRGGQVMTVNPVPDELLEVFLHQVLDCPDCQQGLGDSSRPGHETEH
jgi:hypothetical protein